MRILQYATNFLYPTETFIYNEVDSLARSHEVKVACINRKSESLFPFDSVAILPYPQFPGLGLLRIYLEKWGLAKISYRNRAFADAIQELVEHFVPDVIHCQFGSEAARFLENFTRTDIPVFITFHGFDASEKLKSKVYIRRLKPLLSRSNVFPIFVSEYLRSRFTAHIPVTRSFLLHYGTDIDKFLRSSRDTSRTPYIFLQLSSFREKKGHYYTIKAFQKLLQSDPSLDCRLVLAGDGPLLPEIKKLVHSTGLGNRVIFPGLVNSEEARRLMDDARAFVHHSITASNGDTEGMPNAIMEAMAMELPVLSTYHSGIPELVEDGVNGFLVQEKDIDRYALRMREVMEWGYLSENRQKIENKFEKKRRAEILTSYYREAVSQLR